MNKKQQQWVSLAIGVQMSTLITLLRWTVTRLMQGTRLIHSIPCNQGIYRPRLHLFLRFLASEAWMSSSEWLNFSGPKREGKNMTTRNSRLDSEVWFPSAWFLLLGKSLLLLGTRSKDGDTLSSVLLEALNLLRRKDKYAIFHEAVDTVAVPCYREIISHPMDFSTMEAKIHHQSYQSKVWMNGSCCAVRPLYNLLTCWCLPEFDDFNSDVELIFSNCQTFNPPTTIFFKARFCITVLYTTFSRSKQLPYRNGGERFVAMFTQG